MCFIRVSPISKNSETYAKMKRIFSFLAFVGSLTTIGAQAQISENFNTRTGAAATSQVKGFLQGKCWIFDGFDVNQGWTPALEGDGGMVSGSTATSTQKDGIYSPLVDVPGEVTVTFSYKIDNALTGGAHRWIKFYLTDGDKNVAGGWMDSVDITNKTANTVYVFNKKFWPVGSGSYRVYINYQGTGGNTHFAIDQLTISAPLYYPGGCNSAPVAVNDNLNGAANHSASGMVTGNDNDPNHENFDAYLVTNSTDGNVVLNTDGSFTFTPNPGFAGSFTTFKYRICDWGYSPQCSNDATVTLLFAPSSTLPVSLVDFKGLYQDEGNVELSWVTNFEQNSDRFDIERSLDGVKWEVAGSIKAQGSSGVKKSYVFMDKVSRSVANKKDLYYRLRQVDLDSKAALSKMLIVRVYNTHSLKMVSVSPNPAKNDIAVNVQLNEQSFIVMKIVNGNGAEMMRKSVKADAGSNSYLMDGTSNLKPGMYVLEVTINSKERMIVKLIKE
jgi:hypothetical protein